MINFTRTHVVIGCDSLKKGLLNNHLSPSLELMLMPLLLVAIGTALADAAAATTAAAFVAAVGEIA